MRLKGRKHRKLAKNRERVAIDRRALNVRGCRLKNFDLGRTDECAVAGKSERLRVGRNGGREIALDGDRRMCSCYSCCLPFLSMKLQSLVYVIWCATG